jgi:lipid-binding SYLF domain-containing protein
MRLWNFCWRQVMNRSPLFSTLLAIAALTLSGAPAFAADPSRQDARLITASQVLEELRGTPDQNIPSWLLQRAYGVAVVPDVLKGAFIFGGRYGNGVFTVRDASGHFSDPIFITLAGGSVGWQVGATSTDVVLVFVTPRSVEHFARGKFTLGIDASVAAGPLGRQGEAAAGVNAEIYSYSRARGLFAGVALDGTVLAFDPGANRAFYNDGAVTADMITGGKVGAHSESARHFLSEVVASASGSTPAVSTASAPSATPPQAPAQVPATPPPADNSGHAQTFPMQDNRPGNEPR